MVGIGRYACNLIGSRKKELRDHIHPTKELNGTNRKCHWQKAKIVVGQCLQKRAPSLSTSRMVAMIYRGLYTCWELILLFFGPSVKQGTYHKKCA